MPIEAIILSIKTARTTFLRDGVLTIAEPSFLARLLSGDVSFMGCQAWESQSPDHHPDHSLSIIYPSGNPAGVPVCLRGSHMSRPLVQTEDIEHKFCNSLDDFIQELEKPRADFSGEDEVPWFQLSPGGRELSLH